MQDLENAAPITQDMESAGDDRGRPGQPAAPPDVGQRSTGGVEKAAPRWPALCTAALLLLAVLSMAIGVATMRELTTGKTRLGLIAAADGRVIFVYADGPAALGGIEPGDVLTAGGRGAASLVSNGPHPVAGFTALTVVRRGSYVLVWLRDNVSSSLERFGDEIGLVVAAVLWLAGSSIVPTRRRRAGGAFMATALFTGAAAICALIARDGRAGWPWAIFAPAVLCGLGALILAHLTIAVGRVLSGRVIGLVAAVSGLPAAVALFDGLRSTPGAFAIEVWIAATVGVLALAAIVMPIVAYLRTAHEPTRRVTRLMLLAVVVGLVPLYLGPVLEVAAAFASRSLTTPSLLPLPWWSAPGLAVMAVIQGVVFTARDLRSVEHAIWTGVSFAVAALVLGAACVGPLLAWAPFPRYLAVAVAVIAFPFAQRGVEKLVYKGIRRPRADYKAGLRAAEAAATEAPTSGALASIIAASLAAPLRVRGATLLLRDDEAGGYSIAAPPSLHLPGDAVITDEAAAPMLRRTAGNPLGGLISLSMASSLPGNTPWSYLFAAGSLWTPLWWDGSPRGVLVLGPPLSGDPFDAGDLEGVGTIAAVLALAFHAFDLIGRLRERTTALGSLTHRLSHAHEQERAHLSHELHDVVAQELIALTRQLRRYSDGRIAPPDIQADMLAAAQDALTATRRICNGLRPAILDLGLVPALRDLAADARERDGETEVSLSVDGREQRLVADLEFALFRVAQEGLSNALAHAKARQVRVEVVFDGEMVVRVRDDGRGFVAPPRFEDFPGDHLGLIGMRERLDEFGGVLTLTTAPGRGTILEARAPLLRE